MVDQSLVAFIQESMSWGNDKDEIEKSLLEKGWTHAQIAESFAAANGEQTAFKDQGFSFIQRFLISANKIAQGYSKNFIRKFIISSLVGSAPGILLIILIFTGNMQFNSYGIALLMFFVMPVVMTISYFLFYRLCWKFLSKNSGSIQGLDEGFDWRHAIISYVIMVVIVFGIMYLINAYQVHKDIKEGWESGRYPM